MKKFDSVKMMREIRDKLSKRYAKNPELQAKELKEVRKKHKLAGKRKVTV